MCNIIRKTKRKTAIMYKYVVERDDKFYSPYSGLKIKIGKVIPITLEYFNIASQFLTITYFDFSTSLFNEKNVGKISGFAKLEDAKKYLIDGREDDPILKIKIAGEIWEGDSSKINYAVPYNLKTLFGTEILSFEKVKL